MAGVEAWAALLNNPQITAKVLQQTEDVWENPVLIEAMVRQRLKEAPFRNDAGIEVGDNIHALTNYIGEALNAQPSKDLDDPAVALAVLNRTRSAYQQEEVKRVVEQVLGCRESGSDDERNRLPLSSTLAGMALSIRARGNGAPNPNVTLRLTPQPLFFSNNQTTLVQQLFFRVEATDKKTGQITTYFIDRTGARFDSRTGARFDSFEKLRNGIELPDAIMFLPKDGHLRTDEKGELILTQDGTPESKTSVKKVIYKTAMVGGIVAGGLVIVGTGGTAALALTAGATAVGTVQAAEVVVNRIDRRQTLSLRDPEGRAAVLGLAANAMGFGAFAGHAAVGRIIAGGGRAGRIAALLMGITTVGATVTNGVSAMDEFVQLLFAIKDKKLSQSEIAKVALKITFQTTVSIASAVRSGGGLDDMIGPFNPFKAAQRLMDQYTPKVMNVADLPEHIRATLTSDSVQIVTVDGWRVVVVRPPKDASPQQLAEFYENIAFHIEEARRLIRVEGWVNLCRGLRPGAFRQGTLLYSNYEDIKKIIRWIAHAEAEIASLDQPNPTHDALNRMNDLKLLIDERKRHIKKLEDEIQFYVEHPDVPVPPERGIALPDSKGGGGRKYNAAQIAAFEGELYSLLTQQYELARRINYLESRNVQLLRAINAPYARGRENEIPAEFELNYEKLRLLHDVIEPVNAQLKEKKASDDLIAAVKEKWDLQEYIASLAFRYPYVSLEKLWRELKRYDDLFNPSHKESNDGASHGLKGAAVSDEQKTIEAIKMLDTHIDYYKAHRWKGRDQSDVDKSIKRLEKCRDQLKKTIGILIDDDDINYN